MRRGNLHLLICLGLCVLPMGSQTLPTPSVQYYYISDGKPWPEAQKYCRLWYTDLATFYSSDSLAQAAEVVGSVGEQVWIGLYKNWAWPSTAGLTDLIFNNWEANEPDITDPKKMCAAMQTNGKWISKDCGELQPFICCSSGFSIGPVVIPASCSVVWNTHSWSYAQGTCRMYGSELATVKSSSDNSRAQSVLPASVTAWIGLQAAWRWSDQSQSVFRNWAMTEPAGSKQTCAVMNTTLSDWKENDCGRALPFLCYAKKNKTGTMKCVKQILSVKVLSDHNMNETAVKVDILEKIQQKLNDHGMARATTLTWRLQPDGNDFQKKSSPPTITNSG